MKWEYFGTGLAFVGIGVTLVLALPPPWWLKMPPVLVKIGLFIGLAFLVYGFALTIVGIWPEVLRPRIWSIMTIATGAFIIVAGAVSFTKTETNTHSHKALEELPTLSVEQSAAYDPSDPFSQQFTVTNEGPVSIYDIRYSCVVTYIELASGSNAMPPNSMWVMVPMAPHLEVLHVKQKTNTGCDFIARFGDDLRALNIELLVFYKLKGGSIEYHTEGQKFSGNRISDGHQDRFVWVYGSPDPGFFDQTEATNNRVALIVPFQTSAFPKSRR